VWKIGILLAGQLLICCYGVRTLPEVLTHLHSGSTLSQLKSAQPIHPIYFKILFTPEKLRDSM
jgi:hypothetical protein